jgi:rhomboid protease GluP
MGLSNYTRDLILTNITNEELLVIGLKVANKLDWEIINFNSSGFIAYNSKELKKKHSEISLRFGDDNPDIESHSIVNTFYDFGRNKKFIDEFIQVLNDELEHLDREQLVIEYEELKQNFSSKDIHDVQEGTLAYEISNMSFYDYLIPSKEYFITPIIVYLNVLVLTAMVVVGISPLDPTADQLIQWGGNVRFLTLSGESWRLLTACFLHIGMIHLFMNLNALIFVGFIIEKQIGSLRFGLTYLLTGLFASVISVYWNDNIISAGASGAVFGIYGLYLVLLLFNVVEKSIKKTFLASIVLFVLYNLLYGFAKEGIDNAAHIGGLISGVLIGLIFIPGLKPTSSSLLKRLSPAIAFVAILALSFSVYSRIPKIDVVFNKNVEQFIVQEARALRIYALPQGTSEDSILNIIQNEAIPIWKENIRLMEASLRLDLNEENVKIANTLIEYCKLRLDSYELIYKSIADKTDLYNLSIEAKNREIDEIIKKISSK